jgi:hypothetical protein
MGHKSSHNSELCGPLLADLFFYSYVADFIQGLLRKNEKKLARSFNFTFLYINDVSRYKSKNDADEAVSVVSLTSSSGGYINGTLIFP